MLDVGAGYVGSELEISGTDCAEASKCQPTEILRVISEIIND